MSNWSTSEEHSFESEEIAPNDSQNDDLLKSDSISENINNRDLHGYPCTDIVDSSFSIYLSHCMKNTNIPALLADKTIVFPGENYPIQIDYTEMLSTINNILKNSKYFIIISESDEKSISTLCSIVADNFFDNEVSIEIILHGLKFVKITIRNIIKISPTLDLYIVDYEDETFESDSKNDYLSYCTIGSLKNVNDKILFNTSSVPNIIPRLYNNNKMRQKIKKHLSEIGLPVENIPHDFNELIFTCLRLLPIPFNKRILILNAKTLFDRLQLILLYFERPHEIVCKYCMTYLCYFNNIHLNTLLMNMNHIITSEKHLNFILFNQISEGDIVKVFKKSLFFEGYKCSILKCYDCCHVLGFKFIPVDKQNLQSFYGLDRERVFTLDRDFYIKNLNSNELVLSLLNKNLGFLNIKFINSMLESVKINIVDDEDNSSACLDWDTNQNETFNSQSEASEFDQLIYQNILCEESNTQGSDSEGIPFENAIYDDYGDPYPPRGFRNLRDDPFYEHDYSNLFAGYDSDLWYY